MTKASTDAPATAGTKIIMPAAGEAAAAGEAGAVGKAEAAGQPMPASTAPATTPHKKVTIWNSVFITLLIINVVQSMAQMMSGTLIPLYAYSLGATASMVGMVSSAFAITALAARPLAGPAFDSFSKKWMMFGALIVSGIALFCYGQATTVGGIFFGRLIHGLAMSCSGPLALSLVSDALPPEKLASGVSIYSLAFAISQAIGPALGLWMSGVIGYQPVFYISALLFVVACVLICFLKEPASSMSRRPYKIALNRIFAKGAIIPAVITGILSMAQCCIGSFLAIQGGLLGVGNIGLYFTASAICLLLTRPFFGTMADRYGTTKVIVPGMIAFIASFVILSMANSLFLFIVAAVVGACGYGAVSPLIQALCIQCVPQSSRGAASNTNYTGLDAGNLLGPLVGGFVIEQIQTVTGSEVTAYSMVYLVMIVFIVLGFALFLAKRKRIEELKQAADRVNFEESQAQAPGIE